MAFYKSLCFSMAFFITFLSSSHAYTFEVGGKDGWTVNPKESYNSWSGRLRFLINDTLHFKYNSGLDSVLVVNKGDYDGCNGNNPITKLEGGDSSFKLDRSGPFYFVTGNKSNCDQGQKLTVIVLAIRSRSPPPSVVTPPSPSTLSPSPTGSPVSQSPVSQSPVSPPSATVSPASPPSGSPVLTPPASSPGSGGASSPGSGGASSPGGGGATSPGGESASSPGSGGASSPGGGSASSPGGAGGGSSTSPGGANGESPGGNNPSADVNTPPPPPSAATPSLSGTAFASFVSMIFALWWLN